MFRKVNYRRKAFRLLSLIAFAAIVGWALA
jgi:hypothetical protein